MGYGSYGPNNDTKGLSDNLWKDIIREKAFGRMNSEYGIGLCDDFLGFGATAAISTAACWFTSNGINYKGYIDSDGAVLPGTATDPGIGVAVPSTTPAVDANGVGVVILTPDNDAGDSVVLQAGGGLMMPFNVIHATAGLLVFETRFKVSSIVASSTNLFIGLGGTGCAADNGVRADASGVLASNNVLGFSRNGTATSGLTFSVQRVGGTEQEHADIGTLVADTYIKAGFRFEPLTGLCSIWIDGKLVHTVTHAQTAATPWPTLFMNFVAEMKYAATAGHNLYIDWWACAQLAV